MRTTEYEKLREGIQLNASPAGPARLDEFAAALRRELAGTGHLHSVEADRSEDHDRLVVAMAGYAPGIDDAAVAVDLERIWGRLHSDFWEAHTLLVEPGHIELQGATREGPTAGYVTLHLVVQAAAVPAQRPAPEAVAPAVAPAAAPAAQPAAAVPAQGRRRLFGRSPAPR